MSLRRGRLEINAHEVLWDGVTVWINDPRGCNVARFGRAGLDIHRVTEEQLATDLQCLDCRRHGDSTRESWDLFVEGVKMHHGVTVPSDACPEWALQDVNPFGGLR